MLKRTKSIHALQSGDRHLTVGGGIEPLGKIARFSGTGGHIIRRATGVKNYRVYAALYDRTKRGLLWITKKSTKREMASDRLFKLTKLGGFWASMAEIM